MNTVVIGQFHGKFEIFLFFIYLFFLGKIQREKKNHQSHKYLRVEEWVVCKYTLEIDKL